MIGFGLKLELNFVLRFKVLGIFEMELFGSNLIYSFMDLYWVISR